jgi:GDPmannose 4,6-dehydratase
MDAAFAAVGLDVNDHVSTDQSLLRPLDLSVSRLNPQRARDILNWQARYKGRQLAELLVRCELEDSVGPVAVTGA